MKIIITGGTGLIGSNLCKNLADRGHDIRVLTRKKNPLFPFNQFIWDPEKRFDVFKDSICLFRPGDRIKFDPCDYEEFESIERKVEEGTYAFDVMEDHKFSIKEYKKWLDNLDYKKKF